MASVGVSSSTSAGSLSLLSSLTQVLKPPLITPDRSATEAMVVPAVTRMCRARNGHTNSEWAFQRLPVENPCFPFADRLGGQVVFEQDLRVIDLGRIFGRDP